jgi:hypothetical protein
MQTDVEEVLFLKALSACLQRKDLAWDIIGKDDYNGSFTLRSSRSCILYLITGGSERPSCARALNVAYNSGIPRGIYYRENTVLANLSEKVYSETRLS